MAPALIAACLALAWLVPNHYPPWSAAWNDACAVTGLVALMLWLVASPRRVARVSWPLMTIAAVCAAAIFVQWWSGKIVYGGDAIMAAAYVALWLCAVIAGQALRSGPQGEAQFEVLQRAWLAAAIVSAGIALVQFTGALNFGIYLAELPPTGRPFGNVGQRNHLSTICFLGICALGFLYERSRIQAAAWFAGLGFLMLAMLLSTSRTGWLQLGLLLAWLWWCRSRASLRMPPKLWVAGTALFGGLKLLLPVIAGVLLLSIERAPDDTGSAAIRLRHWAMMVDAIERRPWSGYGWQQVGAAQQRVALDHPPVGEQVDSSHNLLLDLMVWNGIPVGLLIAAAGTWWVLTRLRRCRDAQSAWLLAAVCGLLAHAMLEFPLQYAYFLIPLGLMMGAVDARSEDSPALRVPRAAVAAMAFALGAVFAVIGVEYARAEENQRTLRLEAARIGVDRITTPTPGLKWLTQLEAYLAYARVEERPGLTAEELDRMRLVAERFNTQPVMFRYALAAGLNGQPDVAAQTLARICKIQVEEQCVKTRKMWLARVSELPSLAAVRVPAAPDKAPGHLPPPTLPR